MKKGINRLVIFISICLISIQGFAQKEANVWYFGDRVGLDFNSGTPKLLTGGGFNYRQGTASIADSKGNLLFYTNGETIRDRNHNIMPNGTKLLGGHRVAQPALIVPAPNSQSLYYVFNISDHWIDYGLGYSIVDMSLNGGLGQVTHRTIRLFQRPTQKMAAIRHCNNKDVWVVSTESGTNNFYAFLVTQEGVCSSPIISSAGQTQYNVDYGSLKFSPDGSKLVNTMGAFDTEIFNFDRATGQVTLWKSIPLINRDRKGYASSYYYSSFSPDGTKLYCTSGFVRALDGRCAKVVQYDLNAADISASLTVLHDNSRRKNAAPFERCQSGGIGALQIGPDGKIYITNYTAGSDSGILYLHVINAPNKAGTACNFVENGFYLNGKKGRLGLPNFIESYFDTNNTGCTSPTFNVTVKADFAYQDSCSNQAITFVNRSSSSGNNQRYFWDFGDTNSSNNTSIQENPTHEYSTSGTYTVTLVVQSRLGCLGEPVSDTIRQQLVIYPTPSVSFGADTSLCEGETLVLDATNANATYLWQDNTTGSTYEVTQPGLYWVKATIGQCSTTDTIEVTYNPLTTIALGKDTTLCEGEVLVLDATTANAAYQWSDGSTNSTLQVTQTGTYWVALTVDHCSTTDTIQVAYHPLPSTKLPTELILCEGETTNLDVTLPNATYVWQDQATDPTYKVTKPGTYWVTITTNNCSITDTIQVINPVPNVHIGNDTTICLGTTVTLNAYTPNATYLWSDHSTQATFNVSQAGAYWVEVTVDGCTATATIEIQEKDCTTSLEMPNVVTPNQDGKNDVFAPIRSNNIRSMNTRIYNRWGKEVFSTDQLTIDWKGTTHSGNIVPNGVYFWVIKYTDVNGNKATMNGTVTVLR